MNKLIADQIETIRTRYPQAHAEEGKYEHLIVVPSVLLPKGWNKTICTALFLVSAEFPALAPRHFWVDVPDLLVAHKACPWRPQFTNNTNAIPGFPHWKELTWFGWQLQAWSPWRDTLFTYLMVIRQRLASTY